MKYKTLNALLALIAFLFTLNVQGHENKSTLNLSCQNFSWSDVQTLVEPYLDETLYVALVMQGQSSEYRISEAASMAMDEKLPEVIKKILQSIIKANC